MLKLEKKPAGKLKSAIFATLILPSLASAALTDMDLPVENGVITSPVLFL